MSPSLGEQFGLLHNEFDRSWLLVGKVAVAEMTGNLEVVRYVDSTMARAVLGWNPRSSEGAVTATGQSLIDPGLLERASRR